MRTLVDLFAGAGGLSCGLQQAGFKPILANEINPDYAYTYEENHPSTKMVVDDIRKLCEIDLRNYLGVKKGEVDLLAGGPPCQGFSINAPIRSLDDDRNHLFKDYIRIADALRPKVVLIENVPGIVSMGKGTIVEQIYKELEGLGYRIEHKILFAGEYGVPQLRFRTIFIATRMDTPIEFPYPKYNAQAVRNFTGSKTLCYNLSPKEKLPLLPHTSVWDAISDLPEIPSGGGNDDFIAYPSPPESQYQKNLREGSEGIWNHRCSGLGKVNLTRLKHIPQGGSWRDIPHELLPSGLKRARRSDHTKRYGRLHPDMMCSTVLTKCDPHWGSFFHPEQDRVISVREAARIQSFPDSYKFAGTLVKQYEQVGNAVPPLMAREIGFCIRKMLGD